MKGVFLYRVNYQLLKKEEIRKKNEFKMLLNTKYDNSSLKRRCTHNFCSTENRNIESSHELHEYYCPTCGDEPHDTNPSFVFQLSWTIRHFYGGGPLAATRNAAFLDLS